MQCVSPLLLDGSLVSLYSCQSLPILPKVMPRSLYNNGGTVQFTYPSPRHQPPTLPQPSGFPWEEMEMWHFCQEPEKRPQHNVSSGCAAKLHPSNSRWLVGRGGGTAEASFHHSTIHLKHYLMRIVRFSLEVKKKPHAIVMLITKCLIRLSRLVSGKLYKSKV